MLRSLAVTTVVGLAVVLAACSSTATDDEQGEAGTTTSAASTVTTAAPTTTVSAATVTTAPPVTTTTTSAGPVESGDELAGDWYACEFVETPGEPPVDGCAMFDDDGLRFGSDSVLWAIEVVGGEEVDCLFGNPGRCFPADLEDIEVAVEPVGTWTLSGATVAVTAGECAGTLVWEQGETASVFRPGEMNGCEVLEIDANAADQAAAGGVYFGRHIGVP